MFAEVVYLLYHSYVFFFVFVMKTIGLQKTYPHKPGGSIPFGPGQSHSYQHLDRTWVFGLGGSEDL